MNKRQIEAQKAKIKKEKQALEALKKNYKEALEDINAKILLLQAQPQLQSKIYQLKYQEALKAQVSAILDSLNENNFTTLAKYIEKCYSEGFLGTLYDLQGQGIPLIFPINQKQVATACAYTPDDIKLSKRIYDNVQQLKKDVISEISRGISTGLSYQQMAAGLALYGDASIGRAMTIARTEGHRVQQQATFDCQEKAKEKGADVVKQWDATLDGKTRPDHMKLDGQIRELDKPFEVSGKKAMYPGAFGTPAEDCNCRCILLQRAKWGLDKKELNTLKKRAEFFGLDKTKDLDDFKNKYLKTVEKYGKSGIIRSITMDDFNDAADGKNIDKEVLQEIYSVVEVGEAKGDYYINDFFIKNIESNGMGEVVMQVNPVFGGKQALMTLEISKKMFEGRTLKEINEQLLYSSLTVANNLTEAVYHEEGHLKLFKGLSTSQIQDIENYLQNNTVKGISIIADNDGVEALSEIEVKIRRGDKITEKQESFYNYYMKGIQ